MKNKLPKKDKGLGFLRHWKVMTMTLLLLTFSIGQMWGQTFRYYIAISNEDATSVSSGKLQVFKTSDDEHFENVTSQFTLNSNYSTSSAPSNLFYNSSYAFSNSSTDAILKGVRYTKNKTFTINWTKSILSFNKITFQGFGASSKDENLTVKNSTSDAGETVTLAKGTTITPYEVTKNFTQENGITIVSANTDNAYAITILHAVDHAEITSTATEMVTSESLQMEGWPSGGTWSIAEGGTGTGSITSGGVLTATANGTIKVKYAKDGYGEDIKTITVSDTRSIYWFAAGATDATTAGVAHNATFFTIPTTDRSGQSGNVTLDETEYTLTKRASTTTTQCTFTIPSGTEGALYMAAVSSGSANHTIRIQKTGDASPTDIGTLTGGSSSWSAISKTGLTAGTYTVTSSGNTRPGMLIMKLSAATPVEYYTVTLNPAGGTISPVPTGWTLTAGQYVKSGIEDGSSVALLALTRDGYKLNGWKDEENADYTSPVTVTSDLTLTAQWAQTYAVTYVPNNGVLPAETMTDNNAPYKAGDEVTLLANTFTAPENKEFDEWVATYNDGEVKTLTITAGKFTMPAYPVTITATWKDACALAPTVSATTLGTTSYTTQVVNCAGISVLGSAGCTISEYGFVYGTTTAPTISNNKKALEGDYTVAGTAFPAATLTGLAMNTKYYVRAYATNSFGTAYGAEVEFTTLESLGNVLVVASSASQTSDAITALRDNGFMVTVSAHDNSRSYTGYDLVVLDESLGGSDAQTTTNEESKIKDVNIPILNLKAFFYTKTNRWNWGTPVNGTSGNEIANISTAFCNAQSHPIFAGLTINDGEIDLIDPAKSGNTLQGVTTNTLVEGKEGYTLATSGTGITFIHELTPSQRGVDAKYLMIAISNNAKDNLSADGEKLIVNAAKYLVGSTTWSPATAPTSPAIEATGGAIHAVGDAITMTASASNVSATTLYAWYKGETLEAAEEAGAIQTAKTAAADGTTYSIASCELASAGRYWCVIVNAEGCEASASLELSVSSTPIDTYDITYVSAKGTAPDPENAASVTLAEITGVSGWEHQGWKADVDVVVDDATVTANTLIANGKTAVLSADVTFTAVWRQVLTVTYNANGGTCGTTSATWGEGDAALVLPDATVANLVFDGWYTEATGGTLIGRAGGTYTPTDDIEIFAHFGAKLYQAVYANGFDAFINQSTKTVTVYYLDGTPAPALTSVKAMKADGSEVAAGTFVDNGSTIDVTIDEKTATYTVNKTAVAPYTYVSDDAVVFDGTETYVKTGNSFSTDAGKLGWKFSKNDDDWIRETPGNNRIYFFIGATESVTFTTGCSKDRSARFYRNGELIKTETIAQNTGAVTVAGSNAPAMYAVVSNQTSGDGSIKSMTLAPWVPVTAVALKEGTTPISEKEIWASASFTLTAEVTPDNASNKTITWTSSNEAIATVTDGVVTGVAANASPVTITASTVDGVTATCAVTVTAAPEPCETPVITADPASQAYCAGSEPTLTVAANDPSDGGTLHYAWYKVGDPDAAVGTDAASYTVESAGTYYVIVTNKKDGSLDASATSSNAVVTMNVAAAITTQPTGKSEVVSGSEVTLSVVATNATGYQWYICDDAEKANASAISGAEAADYVFNCSASAYYYCVVGSACGDDITSNVVSVKLEPANCNLIASTPAEEPYQYVQTGEWTLYGIDSNGKLATSSKFKDDAKDFDGNTVNAIADQRVGMIFDKDIESLTIYATSGSTGRTWKGDQQIRVTSDDITSGSPSYTNVTATRAVATMPTNNKQYIFTADEMLIEAGKKVWLPFSGSITIFKICYTAALEKCDAPVLPSLASKELCEGEAITAWDATSTVSDGGTLSYQWYNGDTDEALSGEDDAEFTPSADGNYYVIVTNKKTGYRDNTTKSATLSVEHFAGTAVTTAPANVRKSVGEDATLEVVATGKNLSYVWYTCDDAEGNNPVAIDPAETNATLNVMVPDGIQWYKVVVSSDCGVDLSAVAKVEKFVALPQLHITGTTNWDLTTCADAEIKLTSTTSPKKGEECLMANIEGVHLDANFNSQALVMSGEYIYRTSVTGNPTCAEYMKFITDVEGVVTVTFAGNGSNRLIRVTGANGVQYSTVSTGTGDTHTEKFYVTPGEVELMGMNSAKTSDKQYMRFFSISFNATPNYTRPVTQGRFGTICLPNGGVMVGAALFEVAYHDATLEKIFFDEILNGEMVAGRPYIFLPNDGVSALGVFYTDAANAPAGNYHGLYGSYTQEVLAKEAGNYILYNNQYMYVGASSTNVSVGANRAYFKIGVEGGIPTNAVAPLPGRRRVSMSAVRETPTGLENGELINGENGVQKVLINGELFILRGEKMYDATGRLVK